MAKKIVNRMRASSKKTWPTPVKYLGGGVNGRVYTTNDGRLIKFVYNRAPREYKALEKLQGTHVVPRFKKGNGALLVLPEKLAESVRNEMFPNANLSKDLTVFVMGSVGGSTGMSLKKYVNTHPGANRANIQRRVEYVVGEMASKGVSQGNLHDENIIVSVGPSGRITGMWAIDFGRSFYHKLGKTGTQTFNNMNVYGYPTQSAFTPGRYTNVNVGGNLGSRSNVSMMKAVVGKVVSPGWEKRIANRRKQVANIMKQYKSPGKTPRPKAKSLSPIKRKTSPSRSAPARIATPQKGLKVRFSLKRKRA